MTTPQDPGRRRKQMARRRKKLAEWRAKHPKQDAPQKDKKGAK